MSRALISKIPASEIRPYVKSTRNSNNIRGSLVLLPRLGAVTFDFSKTNATFCTINMKRDSGNGFLLSNSNGANHEHQVTSKLVQAVSFELGPDKMLNLSRSQRSHGNIVILEVLLYEDSISINWNEELKKAKDHACLRLVGDSLHATEGAYINALGVTIKADPPNMVTTDGSGVRFLGPCKITYLNIVGGQSAQPEPEKEESLSEVETVYDTVADGFNNAFCNGHATASSDGVVLNNLGVYSVPVPGIVFGKSYKIDVFASRVDGNGKFMFGLTPNVNSVSYKLVPINGKTMSNVVTPIQANQQYFVSFWRPGSSTGHLKVTKIVVSEYNGVDQVLIKNPVNESHILLSSNPSVVQEKSATEKSATFTSYPVVTDTGSLGLYREEIINGSVLEAAIPSFKFGHVDISLRPRTWSAHNWVSKFCNFIDGVSVDSLQLQGANKSTTEDSVLVTDIFNLVQSRRVLLEEFISVPDAKALEVLKKADLVGTPSLMNAQFLRTHLGDKVVQVPKYWPVFDVEQNQEGSYNLLICRDPEVARRFVQVYQDSNCSKKLVVVGYRGSYIPVKYYDEFVPYPKLLSLILNADAIVDLPRNIHYYSGLLDLAFSADKNIVTTNHWMNISKPKVMVVDSVVNQNGFAVPNMQEVVSALMAQKPKKPNLDLETYNNNLVGTLRILEESW